MVNKRKILLLVVCITIPALSIMCWFLKLAQIKDKLMYDLERTSTVTFYCDLDEGSIKIPLTQSEKEKIIEIFSKGGMKVTFKTSKALPKYWFQTNEYEIGFLEDVEIVVKKDENIHRYIPDKELNSELYKFCQRLILKNSHRH